MEIIMEFCKKSHYELNSAQHRKDYFLSFSFFYAVYQKSTPKMMNNPRANGAKRRSGRKPGARVTNRALGKLKVVGDGRRLALGMS